MRGRPPKLASELRERLRHDIEKSPAELGLKQHLWSGALLSRYLKRKFRVTIGARQCRRIFGELSRANPRVARYAAPTRAVAKLAPMRTSAVVELPSASLPHSLRMNNALRRIRRMAGTGLPVESYVRVLLDIVADAAVDAPEQAATKSLSSPASGQISKDPPVDHHFLVQAGTHLTNLPVRAEEAAAHIRLPSFSRTPAFDRLFSQSGFGHLLWIVSRDRREISGFFPFAASFDLHAFSREKLGFILKAAPLIARGLKAALILGKDAVADPSSFRTLKVRARGAVLLDSRGRVIAINRTANAMFAGLGAYDGLHHELFAEKPTGRALAYVGRTLGRILTLEKVSQAGSPIVRVFAHRTGAAFNLRGTVAMGSGGQHYLMVLIERGELQTHWRQRLYLRWGLTERDLALLEGLARNLTTAEIAQRIEVAPATVKSYLRHIKEKTGIQGMARLREFAREHLL